MEAFRILTIAAAVIAFSSTAAASAVVSEDVPVPGGIAALARALGIDPPDRARCVAELARLAYADARENRQRSGSTFRRLIAYFEGVGQAPSTQHTALATDLVPIPLSAAVWSQAVFHRPIAPADLFAAVMSDPSAALLAHGLAALDDETLRFLVEHPAVLTSLYERHAPAVAAFAAHLRIRDNRVVPPGGERAVPLWEALLHEKVAHPEGFMRELFARDEGRIAYLYDVIGHLDASRAAFALGFWIENPSVRVDRFRALASAASSSFGEWQGTKFPFSRPPHDLLEMFSRIRVLPTGVPEHPAPRWVWVRAFASGEKLGEALRGPENLDPSASSGSPRGKSRGDEDRLVDAAWLAEIMLGHPRWRMDRLNQFAFGQRVSATTDAAALSDLVVAIRTFPRFRMLMLTLERMGVGRPAIYAALARQAERVSALDGVRARAALAQLQGAIAVVARMVRVKTIDGATAETLLGTLGALPFDRERGYRGAFAPWLQLQLRPALVAGNGNGVEDVLLEALAGAPGRIPSKPVSWEGQHYRFDFVASEALRLRRFRERQGGASIDVALDLHRIAQKLAAGAARSNDLHDAIARVTQLGSDLSIGPAAAKTIEKLRTPRNSTDVPGTGLVAERLFELVDLAIGEALLSFSYAVDWSDPQGAGRLARNVVGRHDFGLEKTNREARARAAWALPGAVFEPGVPWRIVGSILGLDVALAPLALRRINADPLTTAPAISTSERDTFVASFGLMNPLTLQDAARDAIAEAVRRGQGRVEALARGGRDATAVPGEIAMDGWRVRALRWTIAHDSQRIGSLFSMTDLLYLGGGRDLDLHPWGMSAMNLLGCLCTHMAPPGLNTALVGRPHLGLLAATVADLNLRVALTLHDLQLPAALAKAVLAFALQDFVDRAKPSDQDDWLTLVRTAQRVSRERIEDYVAAATAAGPLAPALSTEPLRWP